MNKIRWTDKVYLDSQGNIRSFDCCSTDQIKNKLDYKVITRGKCMLCGKELTEGIFFCKECEEKGNKK